MPIATEAKKGRKGSSTPMMPPHFATLAPLAVPASGAGSPGKGSPGKGSPHAPFTPAKGAPAAPAAQQRSSAHLQQSGFFVVQQPFIRTVVTTSAGAGTHRHHHLQPDVLTEGQPTASVLNPASGQGSPALSAQQGPGSPTTPTGEQSAGAHSSGAGPRKLSDAQWQLVAPELVIYLKLKKQLRAQEALLAALGMPVQQALLTYQLVMQPGPWPQQAPPQQAPNDALQVPQPQLPQQAFDTAPPQPMAQAPQLPAQQPAEQVQEQPQQQPQQQQPDDLSWLGDLEQLDAMIAAAGSDWAPPGQETASTSQAAAAPVLPQHEQVQGGSQPAAGAKRGREEDEAALLSQQQQEDAQAALDAWMLELEQGSSDPGMDAMMELIEKESPQDYESGGERRASKRRAL
jgi:hypothetical protein